MGNLNFNASIVLKLNNSLSKINLTIYLQINNKITKFVFLQLQRGWCLKSSIQLENNSSQNDFKRKRV